MTLFSYLSEQHNKGEQNENIMKIIQAYKEAQLKLEQGHRNTLAKVVGDELEKIAKHFDDVQNMSQDFFGRGCKLFNDISDVRSEIENIKDRISEDLTTYIK